MWLELGRTFEFVSERALAVNSVQLLQQNKTGRNCREEFFLSSPLCYL
jgi:hypothetical protein